MRPRLRSLELHGYKTFASRTVFEFPGAITAIVGPNGSGKSNIADAIRWVLGEQAYSLLRAKKTDDMIYLGSELRPRSSMALASVIFDNDDSWLPIDFSEVSLTRRAYRDGDNEYLLNGQRIRLKEITELLSQSGLAERTYTIIGQGSVDAALSLKPEERRRFFEEAAGIGLYRTRREEALNRLETTRRNLERVKDILGELEPRLNGLEKQARKAQEYERIKADLRLLLRDWYGFHWHKSQNELTHTREVVRVQESQLNAARDRLAEVDLQVNAIRARIQTIRSELNTWHEESAAQHKEWEEITKNLAVLEEREKAILDQISATQADFVHQDEEQKSYEIQIVSIREELVQIQADLNEAKGQESVSREAFEKARTERDQKEKLLDNQRRFLLEAETRQIQYKSRVEELTRRGDTIQSSIQASMETQAQSRETLETIRVELEPLESQLTLKRKEIQNMQAERENLTTERSKLEAQIKTLQEEELQQKTNQAKLRAQIDVIEQSERSLAGFAEGSKSLLNAAKKGTLTGNYQPFLSGLEVKPEYEIAIAAVLGEILDGIRLENPSDLESVLTWLESGDNGRAILILEDSTKSGSEHARVTHPGILTQGVDAFKSEITSRSAVNALLDQVYIVEDRRTAREVCRLLPIWGRVVTLKGEVFTGAGVISAGRESRVKLLSRPREKHDLELALARQEDSVHQTAEKISLTREKLASLQTTYQSLAETIRLGEKEIEGIQYKSQQAGLKKDQAQQKLNWVIEQFESYQVELRKINSEINEISDKQTGNEVDLKQYRDESEGTAQLVKTMSLDSLQVQLAHWSTQAAVIEQNLRQTQNRITEKEESIHSLGNRKANLETRLQELNGNLTRTKSEISALHERNKKLADRIHELQEIITPLEGEISEKEEALNSIQDNQNSARLTAQIADRHFSQAQLDLSRQKDAIESLRSRIEEDFGLVAFEYVQEVDGPTPLPLEGMVEQLPVIKELPPAYEENITRQKTQLRRMGPVNLEAQKEFQEVSERYTFLRGQVDDLNKADEDLRQVILELDELMKREFRKTFDAVALEFKQMFTRLFNGGQARLELIDEDDPKSAGVDIEAKLPGRREQGLNLLSGGEKSLTAVALIFALLKVSPTPFCVLDEVDAMLDEANVWRFCDLLKELSENTQFIIITHNRNTVQVADVIYGVTKAKDTSSQVISLKMDEITDEMIR